MARRTYLSEPPPDDDGESEDLLSDDVAYDPDAEDADREFTEGDSPEIPCPRCREPITEDHQRCPHCSMYVTREDAPEPERSTATPFVQWVAWISVIAIVLIWLASVTR